MAWLYFHDIGSWSLWFDEAYSAALISAPPQEVVALTAADVHPPLYYLLLKVWAALFGTSEAALRSFSAVCMIGALGVGFGFVRRFFGARASYAVLPFLVLAPFLLRYGQEARMYALATLICISATYVLLRAEQSKQNKWWILYGILVAAGMYTHYYTALIWIAHWAWHWYMARQTPGARFFDRSWLKAYGLAAILYLPWIPVFLVQARAVQDGFWIPAVTHNSLTNIASNMFLYMQESQVKTWLSLGLIVVVGCSAALLYKTYQLLHGVKKQYFALLLFYSFVPVVLLFVLSLPPMQPVLIERYFVPATLGMYLLIGISVALGPQTRRWVVMKALLVVVALAMLVFGVTNVYRADGQHSQSQAKQLVAQLNERLGSNDVIVITTPYTYFEFAYYDIGGKTYFVDPEHVVGVIGSVNTLIDSPYMVKDLSTFGTSKDNVWLAGSRDIKPDVPKGWTELETIELGGQKAIRYQTK